MKEKIESAVKTRLFFKLQNDPKTLQKESKAFCTKAV
jgi:hypothetical protein